jgi:hypothetical protein
VDEIETNSAKIPGSDVSSSEPGPSSDGCGLLPWPVEGGDRHE